jgi:hypothetical protein
MAKKRRFDVCYKRAAEGMVGIHIPRSGKKPEEKCRV